MGKTAADIDGLAHEAGDPAHSGDALNELIGYCNIRALGDTHVRTLGWFDWLKALRKLRTACKRARRRWPADRDPVRETIDALINVRTYAPPIFEIKAGDEILYSRLRILPENRASLNFWLGLGAGAIASLNRPRAVRKTAQARA